MQFDKKEYTNPALIQLYSNMLLARLIEEKMLVLLRQGKVSKWFSGIGQEAIATGAAMALNEDEWIMPLHRNLFVEPNPVPVKWAMARLGLCGPALRLPLVELGESHRPTVEAALRACGLLRD